MDRATHTISRSAASIPSSAAFRPRAWRRCTTNSSPAPDSILGYGNWTKDAICHATSDDGLHFARDASNPIWRPTGKWNNGRAIDCDVVELGEKLILYYATRDPSGKIQILHAVAAPRKSDFSRGTWRSLADGPVLKPELPWETRCIEAPSAVVRDNRLILFYGGGYNCDPQQIGAAESSDGVRFTRLFDQPLLPNGKPGEWNASESGHPGLFVDNDGPERVKGFGTTAVRI